MISFGQDTCRDLGRPRSRVARDEWVGWVLMSAKARAS